jgi:hypothetical protein
LALAAAMPAECSVFIALERGQDKPKVGPALATAWQPLGYQRPESLRSNHWKRQRQQAAQGDDAFTNLKAPLRNLRRPTGLAGLRRLLAAALRR